MKIPRPPRHLSREAKDWWKRINENWELDDAALLILQSALEAFTRMKLAQKQIEKDGLTIEDRFGMPKENPAIAIERKSRDSMIRALKSLNLDIEPKYEKPGRPGGK
jgi:Phage terminase, small subunit